MSDSKDTSPGVDSEIKAISDNLINEFKKMSTLLSTRSDLRENAKATMDHLQTMLNIMNSTVLAPEANPMEDIYENSLGAFTSSAKSQNQRLSQPAKRLNYRNVNFNGAILSLPVVNSVEEIPPAFYYLETTVLPKQIRNRISGHTESEVSLNWRRDRRPRNNGFRSHWRRNQEHEQPSGIYMRTYRGQVTRVSLTGVNNVNDELAKRQTIPCRYGSREDCARLHKDCGFVHTGEQFSLAGSQSRSSLPTLGDPGTLANHMRRVSFNDIKRLYSSGAANLLAAVIFASRSDTPSFTISEPHIR